MAALGVTGVALVSVATGAAQSSGNPVVVVEPSISGPAVAGETLTGNRGTWNGVRPVTSQNQTIVVQVRVKDTRNYVVRNAVVFIRSTPKVTSGGDNLRTAVDGWITYQLEPEVDFPIKNGYRVQFFVKAYRSGDPSLAGVSGTRLVQVETATP
jgi:hypothetical protein